jgi:FkbM family methyltransferase
MGTSGRQSLVALGYAAIRTGVRLPRAKLLSHFDQWSKLADLLRQLDVNVFLDVGANRGSYSQHLRMAGYTGWLFSFEPIPEDQELIRALAANDPRWTVCGYALGASNGSKTFKVNVNEQGLTVFSSFLLVKKRMQASRDITTEIYRLDDLLPSLIKDVPSPRVFLKMDTQGYDGQVFDGAERCLSQIVGLQSEISVIPLYEGMPHYTQSLLRYEQAGFELMDMFVVNRTRDGRVLEYDCLMGRISDLPEADPSF